MILLLDNYDSFVHNLARYFRRLGCPTKVIRSDQISAEECESLAPDAVVISPGPRRPRDAGCSVEVVRRLSSHTPILGVCLGHQAIGVAFGGLVVRCGPMHGMSSQVTHDATGLFAGCPSPLQVGRYHSLAVDPTCIPDQLQVTATSDDGVVMGLRHCTLPVFGVQFHPESVLTNDGSEILNNFIEISRAASRREATSGEVTS